MITGTIQNGDHMVHTRTAGNYIVVGTGLMKIADGVWVQAIIYQDPDVPPATFIRDETTFRENFHRQGTA